MLLTGKRIAVLAENMFNDLELWYPVIRLREEGAEVTTVGAANVESCKGEVGLQIRVDRSAEQVSAADFDAIVVPGGYAPDRMRRNQAMLKLVRDMFDQGKPVASICHAGWVLASAGVLRNRKVTGWYSIKDDLINAGGEFVDEPVVRDGNLISSRHPGDLGAFCREIIASLSSHE